MRQIAEFVAVQTCALFAGGAVYISFIEHPARMQCGVEILGGAGRARSF